MKVTLTNIYPKPPKSVCNSQIHRLLVQSKKRLFHGEQISVFQMDGGSSTMFQIPKLSVSCTFGKLAMVSRLSIQRAR